MIYSGTPVTTERYLGMVTVKGLRYIINNSSDPEEIRAARKEMKRRRDEKVDDVLPDEGRR